MSSPTHIIIANPTSGTQAAPTLATRVKELLEARGLSTELKLTTAAGDARRLAKEAVTQGATVVVACGGDGTLQEVACSLDGTSTAMGLLPRGRCNDFAHALGLHKSDTPERLAGIIAGGKTRGIDLGAWGEKRFLTVATLGFDSEVSRYVENNKLWLKGTPSYLYAAMRVLTRFQFPFVRLKGDFKTIEGRVLLAATANASCYGGAMHIAPEALVDDGLFHLCVVDQVGKFTVLRILPRVLSGKHASHPAVKIVTSSYVDIETPDGPQWICADGETLGQTPARFEMRPKAIRVLVP